MRPAHGTGAFKLSASRSILLSRQRCGLGKCRSQSDDTASGGSIEDLFSKELRKRGLSLDEGDEAPPNSTTPAPPKETPSSPAPKPKPDDLMDAMASSSSRPSPPPKSPFSGEPDAKSAPRRRSPPPVSYAQVKEVSADESQRDKSMALVNEGLEGLIPRATELIKLGGSFFLAFGPFLLGVAVLFLSVYAVFGENFIHSGRANQGPPPYIDPMELLSERTVDEFVSFR